MQLHLPVPQLQFFNTNSFPNSTTGSHTSSTCKTEPHQMGISAGQCTYAPRPQNISGVPYFDPPSNHGLPPLLQVQPSQLPSQANPIPPQPIFGTQYDLTPKVPNTGYHSFPGTQVPNNGAMLSAPFIYPKHRTTAAT